MIKATTAEGVFLNLVRSILNNEKPSPLPEGVTADEIFEIGSQQEMAPIAFCALNMLSPKPASEKWGEYQKRFFSDCMRSEVQMSEAQKLVKYLCEAGVKILPLKGVVIKELYPTPNLRVMSDVDLLYQGVTPQELAALMEAAGYATESLEKRHHDEFHKKPCMNVELHRGLVSDGSPYKCILENMFDRAIPDESLPNLYHMKPEDLYIYVVVHAAKHFEISGLGVRPIGDVYVLNRQLGAQWNREYIDRQLASVGLERFEAKLRSLALAFFGEEPGAVSDEDMAQLFRGGTYGRGDTVGRKIMGKSGGRIAVFFRCVFIPYAAMSDRFPILRKWPVLLPFAWIYRIFTVLRRGPKSFMNVVHADLSEERIEQVRKTMQSFGLDRQL